MPKLHFQPQISIIIYRLLSVNFKLKVSNFQNIKSLDRSTDQSKYLSNIHRKPQNSQQSRPLVTKNDETINLR